MSIAELQQKLITRHQDFTDRILGIPQARLVQADPGKWNAIQLMDHIRISVKPVRLALQLPPNHAVLGGSLSDVGQVRRMVIDVEVLSATLREAE
jgi:hypothetical protein